MQRQLLTWYRESARDLPWRQNPEPYRTWLSEIMLQQTRVDTVVPYYQRFLSRWPTVEHLAAAPLDEVLGLWSGLGYYSRARNLHKAAQAVVQGGGFPSDVEGLQELPGVGRYTAGAIASIAMGMDAPLVDGNVERVFSRLFCLDEVLGTTKGKGRFWELAQELIPKGEAGDWNQALMELGATVCTPRNPGCDVCPLRSRCGAFSSRSVEEFPKKAKRRAPVDVWSACLVVEASRGLLLGKRAPSGLLGGLWEPPSLPYEKRPSITAEQIQVFTVQTMGLDIRGLSKVGEVEHVFTHLRLKMGVWTGAAEGPALCGPYEEIGFYSVEQFGEMGLSTLARKCLGLRLVSG